MGDKISCVCRDPQLHIVWNSVLEEIQIQVMGDVQIEILKTIIKERFSKTIGKSYPSFGCPKCDAILGDWYYRDYTAFATAYGDGVVDRLEIHMETDLEITADLLHWCHPGDDDFCETN